MSLDYPHLRLSKWPFFVVPQRDVCDFIADRKRIRSDIESLVSSLSRQNTSSIHLLWSWLGAGKTHTLYYIANKAASMDDGSAQLHAVYGEFPRSARSFIDIYRAFMAALPFETLVDHYLEASTGSSSERLIQAMVSAPPDLDTALRVAAMGTTADRMVAYRWLRGDTLPAAEFRRVGIAQRITQSDDAARILATLIRMFELAGESRNGRVSRILWLLDEFQRIGELPNRQIQEISTGLQSTFNAAPTGLSVILSFSGHPEENLPGWIAPGLRDRISRARVLILPPLMAEEGLVFVRDILERFRPPEYVGITDPYFPFTEESVRAIIGIVERNEELKPRSIVSALSWVLQEAEPLLERGKQDSISATFAADALSDYVPVPDGEM